MEPIDYHKYTAGLKGVRRPWGGGFDQGGLSIMAGYEYGNLDRTNALHTAPPYATLGPPYNVVLDESHTITNSFQIGPDYRWSETLDTFVRYKYQDADQPLIGFTFSNGVFNTLLPQEDHIVEIGFNWVPADWFIFNASIGIEESWNHSSPASTQVTPSLSSINFDEQNYPVTLGLWYAASKKLSFSAGYSIFSNFVAQNVTVGNDPAPYSPITGTILPVTLPWNYSGRSQVVTLGSRYRVSENVTLTGEFRMGPGSGRDHQLVDVLPGHRGHNHRPGRLLHGVEYDHARTARRRLEDCPADRHLLPLRVVQLRRHFSGHQTGLAQGVLGGFSATY